MNRPAAEKLKGSVCRMKFVRRLAARNESVRSERPVVIACLGDSVTHGCFDLFVDAEDKYIPHHMPDQGYVAKLGRKLNELFPVAAVTMLNAGISGDGSRGGLERLERDALFFHPDLVIVNFALNDSMSGEAGLEKYAANLREIFQRILDSGAEALLLTPNFMCSYVPHTVVGENLTRIAQEAAKVQNSGVLTKYVEAARAVAKEMNVPVADAYRRWERMRDLGVDTTLLLSNGINHPTVEMHDLFVEEIMRTVFGA